MTHRLFALSLVTAGLMLSQSGDAHLGGGGGDRLPEEVAAVAAPGEVRAFVPEAVERIEALHRRACVEVMRASAARAGGAAAADDEEGATDARLATFFQQHFEAVHLQFFLRLDKMEEQRGWRDLAVYQFLGNSRPKLLQESSMVVADMLLPCLDLSFEWDVFVFALNSRYKGRFEDVHSEESFDAVWKSIIEEERGRREGGDKQYPSTGCAFYETPADGKLSYQFFRAEQLLQQLERTEDEQAELQRMLAFVRDAGVTIIPGDRDGWREEGHLKAA